MLIICRLGVVTFPKLNMLLKPRFFDKFSLDKELCSKVGHVGHEQGKLLPCTAGKENLSIQANVVNLSRKRCGGRHVHCTHEQVKLLWKLSKKTWSCAEVNKCSVAKFSYTVKLYCQLVVARAIPEALNSAS